MRFFLHSIRSMSVVIIIFSFLLFIEMIQNRIWNFCKNDHYFSSYRRKTFVFSFQKFLSLAMHYITGSLKSIDICNYFPFVFEKQKTVYDVGCFQIKTIQTIWFLRKHPRGPTWLWWRSFYCISINKAFKNFLIRFLEDVWKMPIFYTIQIRSVNKNSLKHWTQTYCN